MEIQRPCVDGSLSTRLRANLAAMAAYRPKISALLQSVLPNCSVTFSHGRWGMPTAGSIPENNSRMPDPMWQTLYLLRDIKPALRKREMIGLCGIGDGYLLSALCEFESGVIVVEPEAQNILAAFCLHDFAIAIREPRFNWVIGENWKTDLTRADTIPAAFVRQHPTLSASIESAMQSIKQEQPA